MGAATDPAPLHREIATAYGEAHRHYHTLEHIARVLALWDTMRAGPREPDEVELALWLHDLVYDPRAADNEERSARQAERSLGEAGIAPDRIARIAGLILATRHLEEGPPPGGDARWVLDVDLCILGAPPAEFARYERQVREEYRFRSEAEWRAGRRRVLGAFLARPRIFLTAECAHLEGRARRNLARALRALGGAPPAARE